MSSTLVEDSSSSSGGESATPSASIEHSVRHIKNGTYSLSLTDTQIGAIGELNATLAGSTDNSKHLSDAMDDLAKVLYMPDNAYDMMSDIFISPIVVVMYLRVLAAEGGFLPPKLITGNIAPTQCAIHLCIFSVVRKRWCQRKQTGGKTVVSWIIMS
jgi:hypothetical protein